MRTAARVDENHAQIVKALRQWGCSVLSLAQLGHGVPDLLVAQGGNMWLIEVKAPGKTPNAEQRRWHFAWNAPVHVVHDVDEALRVIRRMPDPGHVE